MGICSNDYSFLFANIHHAKLLATRDLKTMSRESNLSPSRSDLLDAKSMSLQENAMQKRMHTPFQLQNDKDTRLSKRASELRHRNGNGLGIAMTNAHVDGFDSGFRSGRFGVTM